MASLVSDSCYCEKNPYSDSTCKNLNLRSNGNTTLYKTYTADGVDPTFFFEFPWYAIVIPAVLICGCVAFFIVRKGVQGTSNRAANAQSKEPRQTEMRAA
jgi:hypothetical protein